MAHQMFPTSRILVLALATVVSGGAFVITAAAAGREKAIHVFQKDAANPQCTLVADAAGNLYGTTTNGGAAGAGTVFKLTPTMGGGWTYSEIYAFKGYPYDGLFPSGPLTLDQAGDLYGTTVEGGPYVNNCGGGCGVVFVLSPSASGKWSESILHLFRSTFGGRHDGYSPLGGVIQDPSGDLYGTAVHGGSQQEGIAFQLTPIGNGKWKENILHNFAGGIDGGNPGAGLVLDKAGNLFGTTGGGGPNNHGTVFELQPSAGQWSENLIYVFGANSNDGQGPEAPLVFDNQGNLYGTTSEGGLGYGTAFELSYSSGGSWSETLLYSFMFGLTDGYKPLSGLIFDSKGNLYGTTYNGGIEAPACGSGSGPGCGTIFRLSKQPDGTWAENVLLLNGGPEGANPYGGLTFDPAGNLYGTTYYGGSANGNQGAGVVFTVTP